MTKRTPFEQKVYDAAYKAAYKRYLEYYTALKGGEGSGNFGHAGRPGLVGGSAPDGGGTFASIAGTQKIEINYTTFPPSITLEEGVTLYHATSNPSKVRRGGLKPQLPPEISEGTDPADWASLTGVYLTDKEGAQRYLDGRLAGNGEILSVWIPVGTVVYQDPVDYGAVFVQGAIPARGIE